MIYATNQNSAFQIFDANSGRELACFVPLGWLNAMAFDASVRRMAAGDLNGMLYVLKRVSDQPIRTHFFTTIVRLFSFESLAWSPNLTARCHSCRDLFEPAAAVLDAIRDVSSSLGRDERGKPSTTLPASAWDHPGLAGKCLLCRSPLRVNPFIVDNQMTNHWPGASGWCA